MLPPDDTKSTDIIKIALSLSMGIRNSGFKDIIT